MQFIFIIEKKKLIINSKFLKIDDYSNYTKVKNTYYIMTITN